VTSFKGTLGRLHTARISLSLSYCGTFAPMCITARIR